MDSTPELYSGPEFFHSGSRLRHSSRVIIEGRKRRARLATKYSRLGRPSWRAMYGRAVYAMRKPLKRVNGWEREERGMDK